MVCRCPCGNEYAFDPIGHWVCHRCGAMNDAGARGGKNGAILPPDQADELVWDGTEFARRADAAVRENPSAWESWYALGATYGARGNVLEAGLVWTKAASLVPDAGLDGFMKRCAGQMAEYIFKAVVMGVRCNTPYAKGLEDVCIRRLEGRSFCSDVHTRLVGRIAGMMPYEAFSMLNIASEVMMQGISLRPDIRDHVPLLEGMASDRGPGEAKTPNPLKRAASRKVSAFIADRAVPCTLAAEAVRAAVDGMPGDEVQRLASLQPSDGTAGFADRLARAVSAGSDLAYMRATKSSEAERSAAEAEMRSMIDSYVGMFVSGDASAVEDKRVYRP